MTTETDNVQSTAMRTILLAMFAGWAKALNAGEETDRQHFDGDEATQELLYLFGHWSNDIHCVAADLNVAMARSEDGIYTILTELQEKPANAYWRPLKMRWNESIDDYDWVAGRWIEASQDGNVVEEDEVVP
jgi:hypothetical protein